MVTERIEQGSLAQRVIRLNPHGNFYLQKIMSVCVKNHVLLWEKSCQFVGKIMSVCGKISFFRKLHGENTRTYTEKNTRLFSSICRGTASHNVYLMENLLKLKTVKM